VQSGLYVAGSDPLTDRAIQMQPGLDAFLAERSASASAAFDRLAALLGHQGRPVAPVPRQ